MRPSQFYIDEDGPRNANVDVSIIGSYPPPLGVSKGSHCVKKPSPASASSFTSTLMSIGRNGGYQGRANGNSNNGGNNGKAQYRRPVIIYTHSPKVIQTHPQDFMALVQKLTGLSQSEEEDTGGPILKPTLEGHDGDVNGNATGKSGGGSEDTDASSVVTEEHGICGGGDHGQVNSCFMPSVLDQPGNRPNIPFSMPSNSDSLFSNNQPGHSNFGEQRGYFNFGDSGFFNFMPNIHEFGS